MTRQVITVDGEQQVVREDTAKAFRGIHWALLSIAGFILIAALLFFSGALKLAFENDSPSPPAASGPVSNN